MLYLKSRVSKSRPAQPLHNPPLHGIEFPEKKNIDYRWEVLKFQKRVTILHGRCWHCKIGCSFYEVFLKGRVQKTWFLQRIICVPFAWSWYSMKKCNYTREVLNLYEKGGNDRREVLQLQSLMFVLRRVFDGSGFLWFCGWRGPPAPPTPLQKLWKSISFLWFCGWGGTRHSKNYKNPWFSLILWVGGGSRPPHPTPKTMKMHRFSLILWVGGGAPGTPKTMKIHRFSLILAKQKPKAKTYSLRELLTSPNYFLWFCGWGGAPGPPPPPQNP